MMRFADIPRKLRRWRRDERGTATVEFAIMFPIFVTLFLSAVELGMISFRHSMLERGLDMAVRDIRLGTGEEPSHDEIKQAICDFAGVLPSCTDNLRLEMILVDPRNYTPPQAEADCIDHSEEVTPLRSFVHGRSNQMMLMRACYVFSPVIPTAGLGYHLNKDGAGNAAMFATSAFVQEPRG
ncbi:TadE/TadG family type IV pilus assembly protein [Marimonas lutisalis]|uniref:TadE/TadG family type IV pilus assembly protein n=1 Tax=Marimonas lutisalis TaxID=2545756 RepID=UPI0010FA12EB|nr:TadE family protein [Marimonas lutisalis]